MSVAIQFITLYPVITQGASQCPLSLRRPVRLHVCDKQRIEDGGEGGKNPKCTFQIYLISRISTVNG